MGFLSNIVGGGLDSFSAISGLGSTEMYITEGIQYALSEIKAKNWKLNPGYVLEVVSVGDTTGGVDGLGVDGGTLQGFGGIPFPNAVQVGGGGGGGFKPFKLQINPTSIEQQEGFGITVVPTQTGVVAEHQGFVTKDLTVSGTTGIQPKKGAGGVTGDFSFGGSNSLIPSGVPIFTGGKSGYLEMMQLRNYFRSYAEIKKSQAGASFRMVWHNNKDNEHWYVEPVGPGISVSRDASRPFLYDYSMSFKIVGKAQPGGGANSGFGSFLNALNDVENFMTSVTDTIDAVAGVFNGATQFLESIEKNVAIMVFSPLQKASKALNAIKNAKNTISALPKKFYNDLKHNINNLRDNVFDTFGMGSAQYSAVKGRVPISQKRVFLASDVTLIDAFNQIERALDKVISCDVLFTPKAGSNSPTSTSNDVDLAIEINQANSISLRPDSLKGLSDAFGGKLNFKPPASVTEAVIEFGETIERFAARTLGNPTRYHEIILLNNLDPPYFSEVPINGKHTAASGDRILIPSFISPEKSGTTKKNETPLTRDLSVIERTLGVDLKLTIDGDISVNTAIPDVELIAGLNNAAQAVGIKIGVERGSLLLHPNVGTMVQVGKKNVEQVDDIISDIEQGVLADPRFLAIAELGVERDGVTVSIKLMVKIRNLHRSVPLQINAPNVQNI